MKRGVIVIVVFLVMCPYVIAESYSFQDIPTFDEWLKQASGPMVSIVASIAVSLLVEYWPKYQDLAKKWKTVVFFGICLVWAVGCALLRALLGYVTWSFDPLIWHAIWNAFAAAGIGTLAHQFLPKKAAQTEAS